MPNKTIISGAIGLLGTLMMSSAAFAGNCDQGQSCDMGVNVINDYPPVFDAMTVRNTPPMAHLRSVQFQRAPNVSITRVHGMMPSAGLSDAPSAFSGGCHPESTAYCRQDAGTPVNVQMQAPRPAPIFTAPRPAPVVQQPAPLRQWIGGGFDPAKLAPRQYGEFTFTPGTAYLPTSRVVRDPAAAQAVLDSGRTVAQSTTLGGMTTHPSMVSAPSVQRSVTLPGTFNSSMSYGGSAQRGSYGAMPPPVLNGPGVAYDGGAPQTILRETPGMAAMSPAHVGGNKYVSNIGADGTYWEKSSGMTAFGSTVATQVICKRKVDQRVVNPVVGVPVGVPTPVQVPYCNVAPVPHAHGPQGHMGQGQRSQVSKRYSAGQGPWVY